MVTGYGNILKTHPQVMFNQISSHPKVLLSFHTKLRSQSIMRFSLVSHSYELCAHGRDPGINLVSIITRKMHGPSLYHGENPDKLIVEQNSQPLPLHRLVGVKGKSLMLSTMDLGDGCVGGMLAVSAHSIQRDCFHFPRVRKTKKNIKNQAEIYHVVKGEIVNRIRKQQVESREKKLPWAI